MRRKRKNGVKKNRNIQEREMGMRKKEAHVKTNQEAAEEKRTREKGA